MIFMIKRHSQIISQTASKKWLFYSPNLKLCVILELIIYPIVLKIKCSYSPQILHKLLLGAFLVLGSELVLLSLQIVSTFNQQHGLQLHHQHWILI